MPRKITVLSGPRSGSQYEVGNETPQVPGGTDPETGKQETADEAVERMAGTPSNAGKQAQSSDSANKYQ